MAAREVEATWRLVRARMQAIVGLSRGLSRAFVNGVVSRSQNTPESSHGSEAEHRLGE